MIDTLNDLPNVLWIVSEEAPSGSAWWNGHVISTARTYEATKPFVHPIGFASPDNGDTALYNSNADWVAPIARISPTQTSGTGTPPRKVNINDSDHSYFGMWNDSAQTNRNYAWENFASGNQVLFMDPYVIYYPRENRNLSPSPVNGISSAPDPRWNNFRDNLGYILRYSRKLNLAKVSAHASLSSTGWCLAQVPTVGAEYLVYAPSGGAFTVDLSAMAASRSLSVEWFNPATGATTAGSPVSAGATRSFTPPSGGDAVLYLVDTGGHAGGSGPTAPAIATQPANQTVLVGQTATFSITASGSAPLSYQWQKNGADIAGATGSSTTTAATVLGDSGSTYRCVVSNAAGTATSTMATLTVNPPAGGSLPSPWVDADVGAVGATGSASYSAGTFTVAGAGADIWGTADGFNFVYETLTGDGSIVAEVTGLGNTDPWAKAGVMIRETLNANSAFAETLVTPANGSTFQWRASTGASAQSATGPSVAAPYWVKLERAGNAFTGSVSTNGTSWTAVGTATIPMTATVYIGMAVTSHKAGTTTTATMGSVSVGGGGGGSGGGSALASTGGGGGHGGCGATGLELLAVLACALLRRRTSRCSSPDQGRSSIHC
jgi:regulation of enolase protein 1 (concanavalin A-like superfamily)